MRESLRRCVRYVLGNTFVMERVSEFGSVDDGGLIVTVLQSDQIKMDIHTSGEGKGLL